MADFALYREAATTTADSFPLPVLSRHLVLANHAAVEARESSLDRRREVRTRKVVIGPGGKHYSNREFGDLVSVGLGPSDGMRCNEVAQGSFIPLLLARAAPDGELTRFR
jgi:hypothetical protein